MAKRVRISAIGAPAIQADYKDGLESAVRHAENHWEHELSNILCDNPDLIVLPEICDRPHNFNFEQRLEYYDYRADYFLNYFAGIAKKNNCYITYPHVRLHKDGKRSNCVTMLGRNGAAIGTYDKYHLHIDEIKALNGKCGDGAVIFDCDFGRVGAAICFDLNFPQILELYKEKKPGIIVFRLCITGELCKITGRISSAVILPRQLRA
jgi:predicted amidohydrolase